MANGAATLTYSDVEGPGLRREGRGRGFSYRDFAGALVRDEETLRRIRGLAIPPAWRKVWISPDASGHIQAVGRDDRGRRQYRYHPQFRAERENEKFEHMLAFADALPQIRGRIAADMARRGAPREKILAVVAHLLEQTLIRIGNEDYARENGSYGLTTLTNRHVRVTSGAVHFQFKGKSGKLWTTSARDRRLARIVRSIHELPGQRLFQYVDENGELAPLNSGDVNAYLREISGQDVTAKDFRTWAGTVAAAAALAALEPAATLSQAKRNLRAVVKEVAQRLGNTPTVCRQCYIHPRIMESYLEGELTLPPRRDRADDASQLSPIEAGVLDFLRWRTAPAALAA